MRLSVFGSKNGWRSLRNNALSVCIKCGLLSVDDDITDDVALGQSKNAMNTVELYWLQMEPTLSTQATTHS